MSKKKPQPVIRLRGVRHNNLKNFDLDLPLRRLIVITGLSGSGKSTLAFDTLFAEGQRRYIETFSPYARQFFDRMDKPQVDSIEGIPPAIAIEQRNTVKSTRSTVGTMTEICDYMKVLWPQIAQLHCRECGQPVRKDSPQSIWETLTSPSSSSSSSSSKMTQETDSEDQQRDRERQSPREVLVTFDVQLSEKLSLQDSLNLITKQGYQRLLIDEKITRIEDAATHWSENNATSIPLSPQRGEGPGVRGGSGHDQPSSESPPNKSHVVPSFLTVIQDRFKLAPSARARFVEACEHAYHFGRGRLAIRFLADPQSVIRNPQLFSSRLHCAQCDIEYSEPTPAQFSFNHPLGACPACKGFGRIITIDYDLALPDRSKTLKQGAVKPWQSGMSAECQTDLLKFCRATGVRTDIPFDQLPKEHQDWVINGDPDYGIDEEHEWPRAWYGVKGYFRWLESKAYKMHVRVLLSRYRAYTTCPACGGARLKPEAMLHLLTVINPGQLLLDNLLLHMQQKVAGLRTAEHPAKRLTLPDFYTLPVCQALALIASLAKQRSPDARHQPQDAISHALNEVRARLAYLDEVGLGYLTLDRPTRSLSGGETERVNLTTCLGTGLVNTLFILDEPSIGLHPRDTDRLVRILERLRDTGNTVVVVEHEAGVIRSADQVVDLGPGHGATGGEVVFQGPMNKLLKSRASLTGQYLSGRRQIEIPPRRPAKAGQATCLSSRHPQPQNELEALALNDAMIPYGDRLEACPALAITGATRHNLQNLTVEIPLNRFVVITGVSGSGKTTLMREVLLPALQQKLKSAGDNPGPAGSRIEDEDEKENEDDTSSTLSPQAPLLTGWEFLSRVVLVGQSLIGKTPRSNPAVYIGAFDDIRELFAQCETARQRGLKASAFSFNSVQGQCERCRGVGFEKIEMQFLSDVFIRCPDCDGRRYRPHILEVILSPKSKVQSPKRATSRAPKSAIRNPQSAIEWSIADVLEATVDEVIEFLAAFPDSRPARRAGESLKLLQDVGLGYLRLGQPINTLSGGESQRLKLVRHLAEATHKNPNSEGRNPKESRSSKTEGHTDTTPDRPSDFGPLSDLGPRNSDFRHTLFLFDEPTTGLHFDDVRVLLQVFQRLVDAGHSVIVIEHNLDVIKCADWIIDLGPDAGDWGGQVIATGTPEDVARCEASHTGRFLDKVLKMRLRKDRLNLTKRKPTTPRSAGSSFQN